MKKEIEEAIAILSLFSSPDWGLYTYCLTPKEEKEELERVTKARELLRRYGIPDTAVQLHMSRWMNVTPETKRFIDRHNEFVALETSLLPF